jgi:hypothetical protein
MGNGVNGTFKIAGLVVTIGLSLVVGAMGYGDVKSKVRQNTKDISEVKGDINEIKKDQTKLLVQQTIIIEKLEEIKRNTD